MGLTNSSVNVAIRPGRLVVEAFRVLRARPFAFTGIAAVGLVPNLGVRVIDTTWILPYQIALIIVSELVDAALVYAAASLAQSALLGPADIVEAYQVALRKLRDILELLFRQFGAVFILGITIVGIPWAIRLLVRWNFGLYAIIVNDSNAKHAISFSCDVVTGRWWQIFALLIATSTPGTAALALVIFTQSPLIAVAYSVIFTLFATPLFAIFWTVLFLHLRAAHPDHQAEAMSAT